MEGRKLALLLCIALGCPRVWASVTRVALARGDAVGQTGFIKLGTEDQRGRFDSYFAVGGRAVLVSFRGFERLELNPPGTPFDSSVPEDLTNLYMSSLLCEGACTIHIGFSGLKTASTYRFRTYHHSVLRARGGCVFTLKFSSGVPRVLKQHADGRSQSTALFHDEVVRSNSAGELDLSMTKGPTSLDAEMNLNGFEIEELPRKTATLVLSGSYCGNVDHKNFGDELSLLTCADYVQSDADCSSFFSWCPNEYYGRCRCGIATASWPDCYVTENAKREITEVSMVAEQAACNVYKVVAPQAHFEVGVAGCVASAHVLEGSCLESIQTLANASNLPLATHDLTVGSFTGSGSAFAEAPPGCSLSSIGQAVFNLDIPALSTANSAPPGWRQACLDDCEPGFFISGQNCQMCEGGYTRRRRANSCDACLPGHYDNGNFDDCDRCAGSTRRRTATKCTPCLPGWYGSYSDDDCRACVDGATRRRRAESCTSCPPGRFAVDGEDDCRICPGGSTRRRRSTTCTMCPPNTFSAAEQDDCVQCMESVSGSCQLP